MANERKMLLAHAELRGGWEEAGINLRNNHTNESKLAHSEWSRHSRSCVFK